MKTVFAISLLILATALHAQSPAPRWERTGHHSAISSYSISRDSRYILSSGEDGQILLWDRQSPYELPRSYSYPYHELNWDDRPYTSEIQAIQFSGDAKTFWAGGDTCLYQWDIASGRVVDSIVTMPEYTMLIRTSISGDTVLWVSPNLAGRWDVKAKKLIDTVSIPFFDYVYGRITGLNVSDDISSFSYFSYDTISVYSFDQNYWTTFSDDRMIGRVVLSSNGQLLAYLTVDSLVVVDTKTRNVVFTTENRSQLLTPLRFTNGDGSLVCADSSIVSFTLSTGDSVYLGKLPQGNLETRLDGIVLAPDLSCSIAADTKHYPTSFTPLNSALFLSDFKTAKQYELTGNESNISGIEWSPVKAEISACDYAGVVKTYSGESGDAVVSNYGDWYVIETQNLQYNADGTKLSMVFLMYDEHASSDNISYLSADHLGSAGMICDHASSLMFVTSFPRTIVSSNGKHLISGQSVDCDFRSTILYKGVSGFIDSSHVILFDSNGISNYDLDTKTSSVLAFNPLNKIDTVIVSHDGSLLAACERDSMIEIFDITSFQLLQRVRAKTVQFSFNHQYGLFADFDSSLKVIDVYSGNMMGLYSYSRPLIPVGISYDNKYIAATDGDQTIICWDAPANLEVREQHERAQTILEQNIPNPATDQTLIRFSLPYAEQAVIELFDVLGNRVKVLYNGIGAEQTVHADVHDLTPGVYYYRLSCASGVVTRRMIVR
jgi:WD40 repeat protein